MNKNALVSAVALIILVIGILVLSACTPSTTAAVPDTDVPAADFIDISPDYAIEMFRENPRTVLEGYHLNDGYLYGINNSTPIGSIHTYGLAINGQTLSRNFSSEVIHDASSNKLYVCRYGEKEVYELPAHTVFCGVNNDRNVIVRAENDVFLMDISEDIPSFEHIASGVDYVISTDYSYTYGLDSQDWILCPLFLMQDGTLMVYDQTLCPPLFEGGWVDNSFIS